MEIVIPKSHTLKTERLLLRLPSLEDIPATFSATRYKGFNDGMLWDPPGTPEELIKSFEDVIKIWEQGQGYSFSIVKNTDHSFVGRISIRKEKESGTWNLGFWVHPEQQNQGYMKEATKAIIQFGFQTLSAEKIVACHALWNTVSEKVLKNNGMIFSKYIEKGFQKNGIWIEENLLEIKKKNWQR